MEGVPRKLDPEAKGSQMAQVNFFAGSFGSPHEMSEALKVMRADLSHEDMSQMTDPSLSLDAERNELSLADTVELVASSIGLDSDLIEEIERVAALEGCSPTSLLWRALRADAEMMNARQKDLKLLNEIEHLLDDTPDGPLAS